ncbi:universal stress protein [Natribaculum luteum]|uniref:Universal stress protein n=1 Tax=Natribaculum luteum TaxID=1586232 RepID=A0ABD5NYN6_9EURY|nr:universal stress protein [Natribaculum luteum]
MFEKILLPTDGTEFADEIAEWTYLLAGAHDAEVHGLYVNNVSDVIPAATSPAPPNEVADAVEREGEQALSRLEQLRPNGVELTTELRSGNPAKQILDYADEHDVDVVVMGRKGTSLLSNLGSNTHDVVLASDVPITVYPSSA